MLKLEKDVCKNKESINKNNNNKDSINKGFITKNNKNVKVMLI